jgi:hypothetical protein
MFVGYAEAANCCAGIGHAARQRLAQSLLRATAMAPLKLEELQLFHPSITGTQVLFMCCLLHAWFKLSAITGILSRYEAAKLGCSP